MRYISENVPGIRPSDSRDSSPRHSHRLAVLCQEVMGGNREEDCKVPELESLTSNQSPVDNNNNYN